LHFKITSAINIIHFSVCLRADDTLLKFMLQLERNASWMVNFMGTRLAY